MKIELEIEFMIDEYHFKTIIDRLDKFENRGYQAAYELTQSLYTSDKISLAVKSQITNELTELASMTVKQRKFLKRL